MLVGIFGAGRNGSTLLMRLLDGSDGLWVYPIELNYLSSFAPGTWKGRLRRNVASVIPGHRQRVIHDWAAGQLAELKNTYLDKLETPLAVVGNPLDMVTQRTGRSLVADLESFLDALQISYDHRSLERKPHLVFKSIDVPDLWRYHRAFPEMKFVHIVRHPYSNYSSLKRTDMVVKQKPFWFQGGDILRLQVESRWIPHARFILRGIVDEPDRHYVVRYEDLCESPEQAVGGICRWLGVPPPSRSSELTVLGGKRMKELPVNTSKTGVETPRQVVSDMAKQFGYDDVLTDRERALIRLRTFHLARQFRYFTAEGESVLPNKLSLLKQWMVPDQWEYMNARPRIRLVRALVARRLYLCRKLLLPSS